MDKLISQDYSEKKFCQAIIKTGKRSGEVCLYRQNKNQIYCGYHKNINSRKPSLSGEYISKSVQTECSNGTEERVESIQNNNYVLEEKIMDVLNKKLALLMPGDVTSRKEIVEEKSENYTVYIMSCLTAYMDVQFQTLSEQIKQLREILSQFHLKIGVDIIPSNFTLNRPVLEERKYNLSGSKVKTNYNPRLGNVEMLEKDKDDSQKKLEKDLQLYLNKMTKYGSDTETISQLLKGIDIILSSASRSPLRKQS